MSSFQTQVGALQAPAAESGDFCSTNPRYTTLAGPGGIVAGAAGVQVGRFAWLSYSLVDFDNAPAVANNFGTGEPDGFVGRRQQALITAYLGESSNTIQAGENMSMFSAGEFWMKNSGSTVATPGMKAYASYADGTVSFAATGSAATATASSWSITAQTFSVTGSVTGNVMTVTAVGSGTVYEGSVISGTGIASGTKIVSQLTPLLAGEAANGVGRYTLSIAEQTAASTTISGTYGLLTLTTVATGNFGVGDTLTGTSVASGSTISRFISGTGGSGSTAVTLTATASSGTLTGATQYETKWICKSTGAAGELVKTTTVT